MCPSLSSLSVQWQLLTVVFAPPLKLLLTCLTGERVDIKMNQRYSVNTIRRRSHVCVFNMAASAEEFSPISEAFSHTFPSTSAVFDALYHRAVTCGISIGVDEIVTRLASAKALLELQPEMDDVVAAQVEQLLLKDSIHKWTAELKRTDEKIVPSTSTAMKQTPSVLTIAQKKLSSKKRSNLNSEARSLLVGWLTQNARNPYPTEAEKAQLASEAGVSKEQITNFFINARGRSMWKDIAEQQGLTVSRDSETNKWFAE